MTDEELAAIEALIARDPTSAPRDGSDLSYRLSVYRLSVYWTDAVASARKALEWGREERAARLKAEAERGSLDALLSKVREAWKVYDEQADCPHYQAPPDEHEAWEKVQAARRADLSRLLGEGAP